MLGCSFFDDNINGLVPIDELAPIDWQFLNTLCALAEKHKELIYGKEYIKGVRTKMKRSPDVERYEEWNSPQNLFYRDLWMQGYTAALIHIKDTLEKFSQDGEARFRTMMWARFLVDFVIDHRHAFADNCGRVELMIRPPDSEEWEALKRRYSPSRHK
ncbi:MAG: hypothetical protein Q4F00_08885 [bacterium]|nr:hypothetical protein [bacterium]